MIEVQLEHENDIGFSKVLERSALEVLQYANINGDASVVLTGDEKLRELNAQYLGIDSPTDVLSFPSGEVDPDTQELYLGDVIISLPRAALQAAASGHAVEDELALLVVHGMLHLLGHDHADADEKALMWSKQAEILDRLGCRISAPKI
jgi:probable rRNA maturation factor